MSETGAYRALSSKSRLEMLKLLYKKPLSVEEIAQSLGLQPITVRHHLRSLEEAGLIEAYEKRVSTVGRPKVYYRITKEPPIISFPKRRYLTLSNFMINAMKFILGVNRSKKILKKVGTEMGESTVKRLEYKHDIKEWSLKAYEDYFVKKYLEESGAEPEVVKATGNKIVYRLHNCLFFELALKMPEIMCDTLHEGFHEGISSAMGGKAKITRLTCMGKGDPYCEHVCKWKTKN